VSSEPLVDVDFFVNDTKSISLRQDEDTDIEFRRSVVLSTFSRAIYSPVHNIPAGYRPDKHQLKPMNTIERGWFGDILRNENNEPKYKRKGIIVADEGGTGKTLACTIALLSNLNRYHESVLIIAPKLIVPKWRSMFYSTKYRHVNRLTGPKLQHGEIPKGVNIISNRALLDCDFSQERLLEIQEKIKMVVVDEAHEGFITAAEGKDDGDAKMAKSIRVIVNTITSQEENQCILSTATPIRKKFNEIKELMKLIDTDSGGQVVELNEGLIKNMKDFWNPLLNKIVDLNFDLGETLLEISKHLEQYIVLENEEYNTLRSKFSDMEFIDSIENNISKRYELYQDLHPLGRFLSVTLRDDLGANQCNILYRNMNSKLIQFETSKEFDSLLSQIETMEEKPPDYKSKLEDCPINILENHSKLKFGKMKITKSLKKLSEEVWNSDQRLESLFKITQHLIENESKIAKGLVIFAKLRNTCYEIQQALDKKFGKKIESYLFLPPINDNEEYDARQSNLAEAKSNSLKQGDGLPLQIIISGDSGSVGLDMEWANTLVHWSQRKSFGMLAQKTWRLDRRVDEDLRGKISKAFTVYHFIKKDNRNATVKDINNNFRNNRILLGDRNITDESGYLLPISDETFSNSRSKSEKLFEPSGELSSWLWRFVKGEVGTVNSYAEQLSLLAIKSITGLDIEPKQEIFTPQVKSIGDPLHHEYIDARRLFILHTLTEDLDECDFLKQCAGGRNNPQAKILPSSSKSLDKKFRNSTPTLLPNGELHRYLNNKLIKHLIDNPYYHFPFVYQVQDLEDTFRKKGIDKKKLESLKPMSLAINLELFLMLNDRICIEPECDLFFSEKCKNKNHFIEQSKSIGLKLKQALGNNSISPVMQKKQGKWRHLTYSELEDLELIIQSLIAHSLQKGYPDDSYPESNYCDKSIISNDHSLDFVSIFDKIIEQNEDLDTYIFKRKVKQRKRQIQSNSKLSNFVIPLIKIHENENENTRKGCCPVCNAPKEQVDPCSRGPCAEWEPSDEFSYGGWGGWC
jgi:hypothetical protein